MLNLEQTFESIANMKRRMSDYAAKYTPVIPTADDNIDENLRQKMLEVGYTEMDINRMFNQHIIKNQPNMVIPIPTEFRTSYVEPPEETMSQAGGANNMSVQGGLEHIKSPEEMDKYTNITEPDAYNRIYGIPKEFSDTYPNVEKNKLEQMVETKPGETKAEKEYRIEKWNDYKKKNPEMFEALLSGTKIASEKTGVPQDLLMDIAALESSGGQFMEQLGGGPGRGPYQFEVDNSGRVPSDMQNILNEAGLSKFDPKDPAQASLAAGTLISRGQLSRWGTPRGGWGTIDNQNRLADERLSTYYSPEELNKYLRPEYRF